MKKDGFSLIELLITVAIIGILAAIAIPGYIGQHRRAERTEAFANLDNLRLIEAQVFADGGNYYAPNPATVVGSTRAIRDANWTKIRFGPPVPALSRWQPGPSQNMKYSYHIILNVQMTNPNTVPWDGATNALTPCFTAVATAVQGTRVFSQRDVFAIDCNNNKNY
ncbi:MAG: prepilin-type N-terminal cleavage/methylation domain-containing protein [Thermodesulfovibrionales bacterium]